SWICKQDAQVLQTGNSRDGSSLQHLPEQYHEDTGGNGEVSLEKRPPVGCIIFNLYQRGCGRDNSVAADTRDVINRIGRSSIKKSDTENSLPIRGGHQIIFSSSAIAGILVPYLIIKSGRKSASAM